MNIETPPAAAVPPSRPPLGLLLPAGLAALASAAVAGPLLSRGYLFLLDAPTGPQAVFPSLLPLPSEGLAASGIPSSAPVRAVLALLHESAPSATNKLLLLAVLSASVLSLYYLVHTRFQVMREAAAPAALFYAINPFTYERLVSGQLHLMIGYALLPLVLAAVIDLVSRPSSKNAARMATGAAGLLLVSPHVGVIAAILSVAGCGIAAGSGSRRVRAAGAVVVATIGIGAFWILPSVVQVGSADVSVADLEVFATKPRGWGALPHALLLHGFWRTEFETPLGSAPALFLAAALLLGACIGAGLARLRQERVMRLLIPAAITALIISVSTSLPVLRSLSRWIFGGLPGLHLFREPQKWLIVVCVLYAIGLAAGVHALLGKFRGIGRHAILLVTGGAVALAAYPMLWGFGGQVATSAMPAGLSETRSIVDGNGRVLYLPWHEFMSYDFAQGRTLGDVAPYFFGPEVVSSEEDGFLHGSTGDDLDPRKRYVRKLIEQRGLIEEFGALVSPLGVRYIVLAHAEDFRTYSFLEHQDDLRVVLEDDDVSVYENLSWKESVVVSSRTSFGSIRRMLSSPDGQTAASTTLAQIGHRLTGESPRWRLPSRSHGSISVPPGTARITSLSCDDGYTVDGRVPSCHLGALAAFTAPGELHISGESLHFLGYAISVATTLILVVLRSYASRRSRSQ